MIVLALSVPAQAREEGAQHRALLGHGYVSGTGWAVYAQAENLHHRPARPCLTAALDGRVSLGFKSQLKLCGSLETPLLVSNSSGAGSAERTVLAMAFPRRDVAVRLWLKGKKSRLVGLKLLSRRHSKLLGLSRFTYGARAFAGDFCLKRYAAFDRWHRLSELSGRLSCTR